MTHPAPAAGFVTISQGLYDLWMREVGQLHELLDTQEVPREWRDARLTPAQRLGWLLKVWGEAEEAIKRAAR